VRERETERERDTHTHTDRETERDVQVQVFFYFGHGRVKVVWGVEDKFCVILRGLGFDNCGLDLYGVLAAFGSWKEVLGHTTLIVWMAVVFHLDV
jgi:hypothetical protein